MGQLLSIPAVTAGIYLLVRESRVTSMPQKPSEKTKTKKHK